MTCNLLDVIELELLCVLLSEVWPAIDEGASNEIVHHLASRLDTIVLHALKSPAR